MPLQRRRKPLRQKEATRPHRISRADRRRKNEEPSVSTSEKARRHSNLTLGEWLDVFRYIDDHPKATQTQVVEHFKQLPHPILFNQSTLSKKLDRRREYEDRAAETPGALASKRPRAVSNPVVEEALYRWTEEMRISNQIISTAMLVDQRRTLEALHNVPERERLRTPNWVPGFRKAYNIPKPQRHELGAADDADDETSGEEGTSTTSSSGAESSSGRQSMQGDADDFQTEDVGASVDSQEFSMPLAKTAYDDSPIHPAETKPQLDQQEYIKRTMDWIVRRGPEHGSSSGNSDDFRCLRYLTHNFGCLPYSWYLSPEDVQYDVEQAKRGGGYSDIYKGTYRGKTVCVKRLRAFLDTTEAGTHQLLKDLCREALVWKALSHPNILPIFGVLIQGHSHCLVLPWMENGNATDFLKKHPTFNPLNLVRDCLKGLCYLHSLHLGHGDIRGGNLLITDEKTAVLGDFGLARFSHSLTFTSKTDAMSGTLRWLPPEVANNTRTSERVYWSMDMYSAGCTIIELYSGSPPFPDLKYEGEVIVKVYNGIKPPIPQKIQEVQELSKLVDLCLDAQPTRRPTASDFLASLGDD